MRTIQKFNLKEALAGKPCMTRSRQEVRILYDVSEFGETTQYPLQGYYLNTNNHWLSGNWTLKGNYFSDDEISDEDIIGMWVEPKLQPRITECNLPAPLKKVKNGDKVYYITSVNNVFHIIFDNTLLSHQLQLKSGSLFANIADAEEWVNFKKESRR